MIRIEIETNTPACVGDSDKHRMVFQTEVSRALRWWLAGKAAEGTLDDPGEFIIRDTSGQQCGKVVVE